MTTLTIQTDQSREAARETLNRHADEALTVYLWSPSTPLQVSEDMMTHRNGLISEIIEAAANKPNLSSINLTGIRRCLRSASTETISSHIATHLRQGHLNQKRLFISLNPPEHSNTDTRENYHHAFFEALKHSQLNSLEGIEPFR